MAKAQVARGALLEAAMELIREKGFNAMSVEELCARAGVSKGAFFHYFKSKEELGVAAAEHWSAVTSALFAAAPYHEPTDPAERVFAYLAFRRSLLQGPLPAISCVAGSLVQEVYAQHPAIRDACAACIFGHIDTLVEDIAAALHLRGGACDESAQSLAAHTQAVLQGAFILAKARGDVEVAEQSVDHLRRYFELLLRPGAPSMEAETRGGGAPTQDKPRRQRRVEGLGAGDAAS